MSSPALTKDERNFIRYIAKTYHYNPRLIQRVLSRAQYRADILDRIKRPYEDQPWYIYREHLITKIRIQKGVNFWRRNKDTLQFMQHQFNVPSKIIVGILGVETTYGQEQGKYKVLNSLATLSFHYPERTKFFRAQLAEFIRYCLSNHIKPETVLGSYAGAIGQAQFMPTSIKLYAIRSQKKGFLDLSHNEGDVIASISNYLAKHGWHKNQAIIIRAKLANNIDASKLYRHYRKKHLSLKKWKSLGVKPIIAEKKGHSYSSHPYLLAMRLKHGTEYWLVFHNFDVIKSYNNSDNYALAVTLLGSLVKSTYLEERT